MKGDEMIIQAVFASDVAKISIPSTHMDIQPPTRTMAA
jgi:hypothetical protein